MDAILQDLRHSMRWLIRRPGFAAVAILTLALAIGANTAMFSVVHSVLLRPLPYNDPDQLVRIRLGSSYPDLMDLNAQSRTMEHFAGFREQFFDWTQGPVPERIIGALVTGDLLHLLNAQPHLGRMITPEDDQPGKSRVVVVSYRFWQNKMGSARDLQDQKILIAGNAYQVIGVLSRAFRLPGLEADILAPLRVESLQESEARGAHSLRGMARLKSGVTLQQAQSEADAIAVRLEKLYPEENTGMRYRLLSLKESMTQSARKPLLLLLGAVGFVLLIACSNVANLMLVRAQSLQKEIAVCRALGARTGHLIRRLVLENLILALAGGILGLVFAGWLTDLVITLGPKEILTAGQIRLDPVVLLVTAAVSIAAALLFSIAPAIQASRIEPERVLRETSRSTTSGHRIRSWFVVTEMALALTLLIGSGLLLRSFAQLRSIDPGFRTKEILTMNVTLPLTQYAQIAKRTVFFEQVLEQIRSIPGVESVGSTTEQPFGTGASFHNFIIEGRPSMQPGTEPEIYNRSISPDYFSTLSVPLKAGRFFSLQDRAESQHVTIVNEAMVRRYFHGNNQEAIGNRVLWARQQSEPMTIVGVVADTKNLGLENEEVEALYTPFSQETLWWKSWMNLVVRTSLPSSSAAESIRQVVARVDKNIPVAEIYLMDDLIDKYYVSRRFQMMLLGGFALLALLMSIVGIYGVISYTVSQRTQEIGIRMALGAEKQKIIGLVLRQGMLLTLFGVSIGMIASASLTRLLTSLLYEVTPNDPLTFVSVALLLFVIALVACLIPALRATRVNPVVALRYE